MDRLRESADVEALPLRAQRERFDALFETASRIDATDVERFFARRQLKLSASLHPGPGFGLELVELDLHAVAGALDFLLSHGADDRACSLLPGALAPALAGDAARLDHVGLEVFGRLEWYIDALASGLGAARLVGHRIFPSVQVRRALAADPRLEGVRIARVYFERAGRTVNLELFETLQHWLFTAARELSIWHGDADAEVDALVAELEPAAARCLVPIRHVALEVGRFETVRTLHEILSAAPHADAAALPYVGGLSYNPGDASINTKLLPCDRSAESSRRLGPIVEVISYAQGGAQATGATT